MKSAIAWRNPNTFTSMSGPLLGPILASVSLRCYTDSALCFSFDSSPHQRTLERLTLFSFSPFAYISVVELCLPGLHSQPDGLSLFCGSIQFPLRLWLAIYSRLHQVELPPWTRRYICGTIEIHNMHSVVNVLEICEQCGIANCPTNVISCLGCIFSRHFFLSVMKAR